MGTTENEKIVREVYDNFAVGDIPAVLAAFAGDIHWHVPGRSPISGDYTGRQGVVDFFQRFLGLADEGSFSIEVDDLLAGVDQVVALVAVSASRNGRAWASPEVHVWRITDGKASAFREFQGDQQTEDEFWSS
ncbi:MAG: nuclear transport factor 2 family protein [Pseudonocardiaceae bacterium]